MVVGRSSTPDISSPSLALLAALQKQPGLVHSEVKIAIRVLSPLDSATYPSAGAQSFSNRHIDPGPRENATEAQGPPNGSGSH